MRVIAGEARGVPLVTPAGRATRPTSDRLKEAIFSVLGDRGCEGRVLDLFAGSGALGIEALSRGASWCDFVDSSQAACRVISANLAKTKLAGRAHVYCQPVARFVAQAPAAEPYDLILLDPPYDLPGVDDVLVQLANSRLMHANTTLLLEHASRRAAAPAVGPFRLAKTRAHGDSAFSIYTAR
ncbi:MAG: 16S rRNA (guanine(966)-N(2))-methyltransferase RsmD [Chloroflexi bacterium]|nr:16S rRNA (guanine(966)-N(2))-methyltransferase RsmD [Chloroflexota bacterium]